jgi:hypothetical protein
LSSDVRNDLQQLVIEIRELLEPIAQSVGDAAIRREILLALGLDPSQASQPIQIPPSSLASIDAYREQSAADVNLQAFISALADLTQIVQALIDFIRSAAAADSNAPAGFIVEEAVTFFLQAITIAYLRVRWPGVYITVKALQLLEEQAIHFGSMVNLFFKIGDYFDELFGDAIDLETEAHAKQVSDVLLFVSGSIMASLMKADFLYGYDGGPSSTSPLGDAANNRTVTIRLSGKTTDASGNEVKGALLLSMVILPREHGGPGLLMRIEGTGSLEVPVTDNVSFVFATDGPDFLVYMGEGSHNFPASTDASLAVSMVYKSKPTKEIIWGDINGIHLRIGSSKVEGKVGVLDQSIKGEIKDSAFVLKTDATDGFLKTVLDAITSDGKLETKFDFNIGYSKKKGFFIGGGAGLMVSIPLHETLGPLTFNTLTVGLALGEKAGKEPGFKLESSLSFGLDLGVLQASVDRIGLSGLILFDGGEFTLGFKPPNGAGLVVKAGPVQGGGFLNFDHERGEYAGGLELDIGGVVTLTALGLITTKMPDGSEGFSLVAVLAVEFGTPIQLGLGFTWIGIGGIFGLNRTMRLEAMAAGIKSGAAETILFPRNIVANAARIISDLRAYFPAQNDTFLIGGMLKLGWGTPTLVSLSLGVIIQIPPGTFAILGVLTVILPDEEAALLQLKVGFIGAYEPDKERAWFFATLYDSRVLVMTIEGGMGILISWGEENANFVISVGGFHPQYPPPPLPFPIPDRLSINILNYPMARIRVMAYFAVTSCAVMFGARAELFFGFDSVKLEGHLGFDALFEFSPFHFIVQISASISLKVFGVGLFAVRLKGSLEGTSPWRITGKASVSILFFSISVHVSETWGEEVDTVLPGVAAMPLLRAELEADSNWEAAIPAANNLLVSLRALDSTLDGLVLHPLGQLRVSQRKVPLEITIQKIGNQKTTDAKKFTLTVDSAELKKVDDQDELFALGQFQDIDNSKKLSLPAFQMLTGGLVLSVEGRQTRSSRLVKRKVRYELTTIDNNFKRSRRRFFVFWGTLFAHFARGAAVAKAEVSFHQKKKMQPFESRIVASQPGYSVASVVDNQPVAADAMHFRSEALAREYMDQQVAANPGLAQSMHVIPQYEVNA